MTSLDVFYPIVPICIWLCSFRRGRQEDAHEYLVALLDAMHEAALAHLNPKPPREVAETSLIHRIFAGQTRSQVCLRLLLYGLQDGRYLQPYVLLYKIHLQGCW